MLRERSQMAHQSAQGQASITSWVMGLSLCLLVLAGLLGCSETPRLKPLANDAVILAFGDSLTRGVGVPIEQSYPSELARLTGLTVINAGVSGEVTAQGRFRLTQLLAQHQPDLVVLCLGGNDILRRLKSDLIEANLRAMISEIQAAGIDVVMLAVPVFGLFPSAPDYFSKLADEAMIPLELDIIPALEREIKYKSDGIHFNDEGYKLMASAVFQLMKDAGALVL